MTGWTVQLSKVARRDLRQLDEGPRQAALELLDDLRELGPALIPAIELRHYPDTWRARFHHELYRMLYLVAKGQKRIIVKRIRPRPTAYIGLKKPGPKKRKPKPGK